MKKRRRSQNPPPFPPNVTEMQPIPTQSEEEARRLIYQDLISRNLPALEQFSQLPPAPQLPPPITLPPAGQLPPPITLPPAGQLPPIMPSATIINGVSGPFGVGGGGLKTTQEPMPPSIEQPIQSTLRNVPPQLPILPPTQAKPQTVRRPPAPTFEDAMARQMYENFMAQQLNMRMAQQAQLPPVPPLVVPPINQQAAQNFASVTQGNPTPTYPVALPIQNSASQPPASFDRIQASGPVGFGGGKNKPQKIGFGYLPQNPVVPLGY